MQEKIVKLYALQDQAGTACFETCLCHYHLDQKPVAIARTKQHFLDCQMTGVGHADNEVTDFVTWYEVHLWPKMECIVCGRTRKEEVRPPDTDYDPYGE